MVYANVPQSRVSTSFETANLMVPDLDVVPWLGIQSKGLGLLLRVMRVRPHDTDRCSGDLG